MGGYRRLGSEVLASAGFLTLSAERFATPAGADFTRWIVTHPGAVVAVPLLASASDGTGDGDGGDAGDVVLVRQFRPALSGPMLELPAGKLDVPGEDPDAAVARELAEEIGMRPGRLVKLTEFWNSPGFSTELTHLYLALDLEPGERSPTSDEEEQDMTVERVPLRTAVGWAGDGTIVDAKSIIGLLLAQRWLERRCRAAT